jgi:phage FluMu protein Com
MSPQGHPALRMSGRIHWLEMRCLRCRHLLQKVERDALRPGKCLEIKCPHCKVINSLIGRPADACGAEPLRAGAPSDHSERQWAEEDVWEE